MSIITRAEAEDILNDERCVCGRHKKLRDAFCKDDFFGLPYELRRSLYSRVGQGFEEAYSAAKDIIKIKYQERQAR